jgi:pimeloyl-ACP methyl ester carboxylesterase
MDRLLTEKLGTVHHYPTVPLDHMNQDAFDDFRALDPVGSIAVEADGSALVLTSPVACEYLENRVARVLCYNAKCPRATILFVHGLFDDSRETYAFMLGGLLKAGYSVRLMTLPFHHERTPACSRFSGEYFWSANVLRTCRALKQSVYELYQCHNWLTHTTHQPVFLAGFSMGATVSLMLAALNSAPRGLFVVNPAGALSDIVWDSPLCRTIRDDFLAVGCGRKEVTNVFVGFENALSGGHRMSPNTICMASALYDEVTKQEQYDAIASKWNLRHRLRYKAGHLNTLRLPRLAEDMTRFFDLLMSNVKMESQIQ